MPPTTTRHVLSVPAISALTLLAGCSIRYGGSMSQDAALNALRAENHDLKNQVAAKDRQIAELTGKLAPASGFSGDVLQAMPSVVSITLDSLSGVWIDGGKPSGVFYIKPLDGRNYFTQVTGTLHAEVATTPVAAGEAPVFLAKTDLSALQVRDAFRSSLAGTYYKIQIPLDPTTVHPGTPCTLRVTFTDAVSAKVLTAERSRPAQSGDTNPTDSPKRTTRSGE